MNVLQIKTSNLLRQLSMKPFHRFGFKGAFYYRESYWQTLEYGLYIVQSHNSVLFKYL